MTNVKNYKPDYLKVRKSNSQAGDIETIVNAHFKEYYEHLRFVGTDCHGEIKPAYFGSLREIFRIEDITVLKFHPLSVDVGAARESETLYKTREEALTAAIKYLEEKGYEAKQFDLAGSITKS